MAIQPDTEKKSQSEQTAHTSNKQTTAKPETNQTPKIQIENKNYLFDVNTHSLGELEALLVRAEAILLTHPTGFKKPNIIMIIHGPDIDWFTPENSDNNRTLLDLAARLDAYHVIDMKVCETTMNSRGITRDSLPAFIESVPYAPEAIDNLLRQGYINL